MSSKRDGGAWLLPLLSWHFWTAKCQAPPSRKGVHSFAFIAFFVIFHKISCVVHGLPDSGTIETMPDTNIEPELTSLRTKLTVEIDKDKKEIECLKKRMNKNEVLLEAVKGALAAIHPVRYRHWLRFQTSDDPRSDQSDYKTSFHPG